VKLSELPLFDVLTCFQVYLTNVSHQYHQSVNCYNKFELTKCEILSETYEREGDHDFATVAFVANMIQSDSREQTGFMETSLFERAGKHIQNGAWLYKDGVISDPPIIISGDD
jgi:UPF0225 domain